MIKYFLYHILNLKINKILPIKCFADNKSLGKCIIHEITARNEVKSTKWCKSESQLADCLT